jgi:hypothetical protein
VNFFASYITLWGMYRDGFLTVVEFNENIITGDFHTTLNYGVVGLFVYLFYITYTVQNLSIEKIVRYRKRKKYLKKQCKYVIEATIPFVLLHEVVSVTFLFVWGNVDILIQHKWILGITFQIIAACTYYLMFYFIYGILAAKIGRNLSLVATALLGALEYYCSFSFLQNVWLPCNEIALMGKLCTGLYSESDCGFALLSLGVCMAVFSCFYFKINGREDILAHEKG